MSLRTPIARVRGLGSARQGTHHWWQQRLTALILVPLTLWLVISLVSISAGDHAVVTQWMHRPLNAVFLILFIVAIFHHAQLGIQVVIEDYVHTEWEKIAGIILVKFLSVMAGTASVLSVLVVYLGF